MTGSRRLGQVRVLALHIKLPLPLWSNILLVAAFFRNTGLHRSCLSPLWHVFRFVIVFFFFFKPLSSHFLSWHELQRFFLARSCDERSGIKVISFFGDGPLGLDILEGYKFASRLRTFELPYEKSSASI
jgi:hypothetical protein